ncbi:MAG: SpoIID/LytB domain-containing protein [Vicinamibacterales bacterium]
MRALPVVVAALLALSGPPGHAVSRAAGPAAAGQPAVPIGTTAVRIGILRNGTYEVVSVPLEVYVGRVLAGEAAPASPPASLEALAIAIRTYTLTNRSRHQAEGFDLCDQTHCQVMRTATPATERAALATAEQVLLYDGVPATVFYSASCGGRTEKPSNVWPTADDPPYLPIHDDDGCGGFPAWSAELAIGDLQRALRAGGFTGTLRDVRVSAHNDAGRVARVALEGMAPAEITGQDLRMVVGRSLGFQHLQSTQFELRRRGTAFRFTGRGAGHGVGMCVIGSMKLAAAGQDVRSILARYYPGTTLGTVGARLTAAPPVRRGPSVAAPPAAAASREPRAPVAPAPVTVAPPEAAGRRAVDAVASSDITVVLESADPGEHRALLALVARERSTVAAALGEAPRPVRVRVFDTNEAYARAAGRPWFTLAATIGDEILLTPTWMLRQRGMLERSLRRALVHQYVDPVLPATPAWVREGVAVHLADPGAPNTSRPPCPTDSELENPASIGALADALGRARACAERQLRGNRDWRTVR